MNKEIRINNKTMHWVLILYNWQKNRNNSSVNSKTNNSKFRMQILTTTMIIDYSSNN